MGNVIRDASQTIGAASVQVAVQQEGGARKALSIINTSPSGQTISLAWGKAAVAGAGIVLYSGGSWSESEDNTFQPSNMEIWAISSAAAGTISIHERVTTRDK